MGNDQMTLDEFLAWSESSQIDPRFYRLSSSAEGDIYVLERSSGGWAVFYSERGNRNSEKWYPDEGHALDDLKARLERDGTVRLRPGHPVHGPGAKLYVGVIWISDKPGTRVSVWAENPNAAREQVEAEYGKGHVISLHNEEDAERPR